MRYRDHTGVHRKISEYFLANAPYFSYDFSIMAAISEASQQSIEPQFLLQAQQSGIKLRIGEMNKTVHEGTIREVGRYELNLEENGRIVTILKREISHISVSEQFLTLPTPQSAIDASSQSQDEAAAGRPNIQQEFLDKAIRENHYLTFFLLNGQRIKAGLQAYDNFTLLLKEGGRQHLYYKHSISTINR